jgi:hypothetical protein
MGRIVIDPVTRIEGHLKVEAITERGVVKEARCSGLLFRGIELILRGRDECALRRTPSPRHWLSTMPSGSPSRCPTTAG